MGAIEPPFDPAIDTPEWAREDAAIVELCRRDFEFRIQCQLAETEAEQQRCQREALPRLEEIMLAGWASLPGFVSGSGEHIWQLKRIGSERGRLTREFVCEDCGSREYEITTVDGREWTETSAKRECPGPGS